MQAVNLLPEYARPGHRWTTAGSDLSARRTLPLGGAAAIVAALLFGALYFHERSTVSDKKSALTTAQARLVAQEARAQPIKDAQAANQARLAFLRATVASRINWDAALGDLGRVLPTGVHLTSLTATPPTVAPVIPSTSTSTSTSTTTSTSTPTSIPSTPPPTTAPAFSFVGVASSHDRVALTLDRLALLPWLTGITLESTNLSPAGLVFTIGATYVPGAGR